ncbi:PAAR domain-containing protein [Burkholderia vietnamiensis]|uniref:PAAR domain-containing protein n=1 Tax=Burkholderia vietnamiensis TaxID=60552 RepID=UPI0008420B93|nr:PAAR domain-containing protein [Burkholderia vietnamiensis]AOJ13138.1 hypothetical protein WJ02_05835 [Burkholderia vietnamiensis]HDR9256425.1 PAAR domain-containing protein [Burkholderia vietnamiensis]
MSQRALLRKGDESSAGGVVLEGIEAVQHYGVPRTFVGAEVFCPTCNSIGHIEAQGQRLPMSMFGKEQALEDDICRCKCDPPPRMIASQHTAVQNFDSAIQAARSPGGNSGYGMAAGAAVVGTATAWAASSTPASASANSSEAVEPSTLLGDAEPLTYREGPVIGNAQELAARGVSAAQEAECFEQYEFDLKECEFYSAMTQDRYTFIACKAQAFTKYNQCRGY